MSLLSGTSPSHRSERTAVHRRLAAYRPDEERIGLVVGLEPSPIKVKVTQ